jgi:hypothetical protein
VSIIGSDVAEAAPPSNEGGPLRMYGIMPPSEWLSE